MEQGYGMMNVPCVMTDRERFEAFASGRWPGILPFRDGDSYRSLMLHAAWAGWGAAPISTLEPIPMILHCPTCGLQHIDSADGIEGWTNPPHRSHLCHRCNTTWRPCDLATTGVESISTKGSADKAQPWPPIPQLNEVRDAARYRAINTPEVKDFLEGVHREALHQRERWAASGDAGKGDSDWFWLIGFLAGKAIRPNQSPEKQLHHIITTAAACLNWHGARAGNYIDMRPGIEEPKT